MKSLIIHGVQRTQKSKLAQSILSLHPCIYTRRLHHSIDVLKLGSFKELPYLRCVLFDDVPSEERILELDRSVSVFAPNVSIIYVIQKELISKQIEGKERFNIITMLP